MVDTAAKFEYSFCLPSEGEKVLVHFVADRPDLVATVGAACFKEWQDAIENDFNIHSAEEFTQAILDRKMNTQSPFVLVAHTEQVRQGYTGIPPPHQGIDSKVMAHGGIRGHAVMHGITDGVRGLRHSHYSHSCSTLSAF